MLLSRNVVVAALVVGGMTAVGGGPAERGGLVALVKPSPTPSPTPRPTASGTRMAASPTATRRTGRAKQNLPRSVGPSPTPPVRAAVLPVLTIRVTNAVDDITVGQRVEYAIAIRNASAAAQSVTVTVNLALGVADLASVAGSRDGSGWRWPVTVPADQTVTLTLAATVAPTTAAVRRTTVTACGHHAGDTIAWCATDVDAVQLPVSGVRRPWWVPVAAFGSGAGVVLIAAVMLWWRRRRVHYQTMTASAPRPQRDAVAVGSGYGPACTRRRR